MSAEIGKSLVNRDQPAPLGLNAGPEVIILCSLPALPHYRRCIVSARDCQVGNLPGQILIDLDARTHWPLSRWSGTKSALLTASAANFSAALMSSPVISG